MSDQLTAQSLFKGMLKRDVVPLLKEHGYRRTRNRWGALSKIGWRVIDFQCSQWSNKNELSFTINLGFLSRRVCELRGTPLAINSPPSESSCHYRERIGRFLPDRQSEWWTIDSESVHPVIARIRRLMSPEQIGASVRAIVEDEALPHLAMFADDTFLLKTIERSKGSNLVPWLDHAALILEVRGEKAFEQFVHPVLNRPDNVEHRAEWVKELGRMGYRDRR